MSRRACTYCCTCLRPLMARMRSAAKSALPPLLGDERTNADIAKRRETHLRHDGLFAYASFGLYVGGSDHLAPLFSFVGDELPKSWDVVGMGIPPSSVSRVLI